MLKKKADKWVKALRSGKYKQGTGLLVQSRDNGRGKEVFEHCCLGVLAEISGIKRDEIMGSELLDGWNDKCGLKTNNGKPYDEFGDFKKIQIKTVNRGTVREGNLADINDSKVSFKKIANWIEKNYKLL